jgi:hypothetical protein
VNLRASVPHSGIPEGNIFFCPCTALVISSKDNIPASWLAFDPASKFCTTGQFFLTSSRQHIAFINNFSM